MLVNNQAERKYCPARIVGSYPALHGLGERHNEHLLVNSHTSMQLLSMFRNLDPSWK